MKDTLKIYGLGIEISNPRKSMSYTQALGLSLIEGDGDGWRLPTIKEWRYLDTLGSLGVISLYGSYFLTSETDPEYIPEKIRDSDPEIQGNLMEDPFYYDNSGIDQIYIWDTREHEEWGGQYDGDLYPYLLIRKIKK
jgi:hypothetical protein